MATGPVKWFNDAKGYGFITPDDGARTCSSISPPSPGRFQSPRRGANVEYETEDGPRGPQARSVTPSCKSAPRGGHARASRRPCPPSALYVRMEAPSLSKKKRPLKWTAKSSKRSEAACTASRSTGGDHEVLAYMAGKMRKFRIRIVVGDQVQFQLSTVRPDPRSHRLSKPSRPATAGPLSRMPSGPSGRWSRRATVSSVTAARRMQPRHDVDRAVRVPGRVEPVETRSRSPAIREARRAPRRGRRRG